MTEVFKDIEGYEGLYSISNYGNVMSLHKFNSKKRKNGNYISIKKNRNGYCFVSLFKDKKEKQVSLHRLVAKHFVDGYKDGLHVDHIDMNKENNISSNLRWCTCRQNNLFSRLTKKKESSDYIGVYYDKNVNKYKSGVKIKNKNIHLGYFDNQEEANIAYQNKLKELNLF